LGIERFALLVQKRFRCGLQTTALGAFWFVVQPSSNPYLHVVFSHDRGLSEQISAFGFYMSGIITSGILFKWAEQA